jgi:hypothetical protein
MDFVGSQGSSGKYGCDPRCNGCRGTGADRCITCVNNAHFDSRGFCVCDEYWRGESCSIYDYNDVYGDSHDYKYENRAGYYPNTHDGYQYDNHNDIGYYDHNKNGWYDYSDYATDRMNMHVYN